MAYPDDGDPIKLQVLEALRDAMKLIKPPAFHHDVKAAFVYEGRQIVAGTYFPVIIVAPESDGVTGTLSCQRKIHDMTVSAVGAIRYTPASQDWKTQITWLAADIEKAITDDPQYGGLAVYTDITNSEVFDAAADNLALCKLTLRIQYRTRYGNPTLTA